MMQSNRISIEVPTEFQQLLESYQKYTGTEPQAYIQALIEKTAPTLQAIVESFEEAGGDGEVAMEIYGKKMAQSMLEQQTKQQQAMQQKTS